MQNDKTWEQISQNYRVEREKASFNAILLDKLICNIVVGHEKVTSILDFGAGIGTYSKFLGDKDYIVTAYEPDDNMLRVLKENINNLSNIKVINTRDDYLEKQYDLILCLNVLDHIDKFESTIKEFHDLLYENGTLLLALPHPLKDLGDWEKIYEDGKWNYLCYRLDGYLKEGLCSKTREDLNGNIIINSVNSYHRIISTYYNTLLETGFIINKMHEPKPDEKYKIELPTLYEKSSRIPYFIVFECKKGEYCYGK